MSSFIFKPTLQQVCDTGNSTSTTVLGNPVLTLGATGTTQQTVINSSGFLGLNIIVGTNSTYSFQENSINIGGNSNILLTHLTNNFQEILANNDSMISFYNLGGGKANIEFFRNGGTANFGTGKNIIHWLEGSQPSTNPIINSVFMYISGEVLKIKNSSGNVVTLDGTVSLAGDVINSSSSNTVTAIQGNPVQVLTAGASQDGYVYTWSNSNGQFRLAPQTGGGGGGVLNGDVTGLSSSNTVTKIRGNSVQSLTLGATQDGYVATWVNSSSEIRFKPLGGGTLASVLNAGNTSGSNDLIISNGQVLYTQSLQSPAGTPTGNALSIFSGQGSSGAGGNLTIQAGNSATGGNGGDLSLGSGASLDSSGNGGNVYLIPGSGASTGIVGIYSILNMNTNKITNVVNPTSAQDAATKNYVDTTAIRLVGDGLKLSSSTVSFNDGYSNGCSWIYLTSNNSWWNLGVLTGTDLSDADQTLQVTSGCQWFLQPSALTAQRTKTLGTTGASAGVVVTIIRLGAAGTALQNMVIANGGTGGGNLYTFPQGVQFPIEASFRYDGTNWVLASWRYLTAPSDK